MSEDTDDAARVLAEKVAAESATFARSSRAFAARSATEDEAAEDEAAEQAVAEAAASSRTSDASEVAAEELALLRLKDLLVLPKASSDDGLPWREGGCWPLDEAQRQLLAFEALLLLLPTTDPEPDLAPPGPPEPPPGPAPVPPPPEEVAPLGAEKRALAADAGEGAEEPLPPEVDLDPQSFDMLAEELSRNLSSALYRPDEAPADVDAQPALARGASLGAQMSGASEGDEGGSELGRWISTRVLASQWVGRLLADDSSRPQGASDGPSRDGGALFAPRRGSGAGAAAGQRGGGAGTARVEQAAVREMRARFGVAGETSARLSRLLRLPVPPPGWDVWSEPGLGDDMVGGRAVASLFRDLQVYVPYRLLLLQSLSREHFPSSSEWRAFGERQLAAFGAGLLAAVASAPADTSWPVAVDVDQRRELRREEVEALLQAISLDEVLPNLGSAAEGAAAALQLALRRLNTLAWNVYSRLGTVWQDVPSPEATLPFMYPASVGLYQPLVDSLFEGGEGGDGRPVEAEVARLLESGALAAARATLGISLHQHELCVLQRAFQGWLAAAQLPDETPLKEALARRASDAASALRRELRRLHTSREVWRPHDRRDHVEGLPSILRFLHSLLLDYHTVFAADGPLQLSAAAFADTAGAYFTLVALAHEHADAAGIDAQLYLLSAEELSLKRADEAAAAASGEAEPAPAEEEGEASPEALWEKLLATEARLEGGHDALQELLARGPCQARADPVVRDVLGLPPLSGSPRLARAGSASSISSISSAEAEAAGRAVGAEPAASDAAAASGGGAAGSVQELADQADAIALIKAGHSSNSEHDPRRALACFEAAYTLSPQVPTLISAANMQLKNSRCGAAIAMYRHVLDDSAHADGDLNPRHRAIAQRKLREAEDLASALRRTAAKLSSRHDEALAKRTQREAAAAAAAREAEEAASRAAEAAAAAEAERKGKGLPPPLPTAEELSVLLAEQARSLLRTSAARRWECRLQKLELHAALHDLRPAQLVELTELLYQDAVLEATVFAPAFAPYASADTLDSVLRLWSGRWRAVSSSAMEHLQDAALSASDKMDALGEWAPLWPPLESLNRLYVARGLPRLADVYGIVEPLMAEYTANLTTRFDDELEAAWQRERWEAMGLADGHRHAAVVWDLFTLFSSSLDVFFEPARHGGPMLAEWVETVAARCFFILNKFVNRMRQELGSDASLLPPKPSYPELQDLGGLTKGFATGIKSLLAEQGRKKSVLQAANTVGALCVRLHSLSFCIAQLDALSAMIDDSWAALVARRVADGASAAEEEPSPTTILHAGAPEAVAASCAELCWFLGAKVVYQDLKGPLFDELYCRERDVSGKVDPRSPLKPTLSSPSAGSADGTPLLVELLEEVLGKLGEDLLSDSAPPSPTRDASRAPASPGIAVAMSGREHGRWSSSVLAEAAAEAGGGGGAQLEADNSELRDAAVRGVLVAVVQALERILLDGGPRRVFVPGDAPSLLEDVQLLREFFVARDAEGTVHGLAEEEVDLVSERLLGIVRLMHLPTGELTARFVDEAERLPDTDERDPFTRANLGRVVLHRAAADPAAKAFVASHRAWLQRVLQRQDAKPESVRERCYSGNMLLQRSGSGATVAAATSSSPQLKVTTPEAERTPSSEVTQSF